jgi:hypothetical protein
MLPKQNEMDYFFLELKNHPSCSTELFDKCQTEDHTLDDRALKSPTRGIGSFGLFVSTLRGVHRNELLKMKK